MKPAETPHLASMKGVHDEHASMDPNPRDHAATQAEADLAPRGQQDHNDQAATQDRGQAKQRQG